MLHAMVTTIKNALSSREIQQIGSVLYYEMLSTNPDIENIAPFIQYFSRIMRDAFIKSLTTSRRQIAIKLPMVVVLPSNKPSLDLIAEKENLGNLKNSDENSPDSANLEKEQEKFVIYGCPPAIETSCRTIMPRALRAAAEKCEIEIEQIGFDPSVCLIDSRDKVDLIETLTAILLDSV